MEKEGQAFLLPVKRWLIETIELFGQAIIGLNPFNIEKIHEVMDKISAFALGQKQQSILLVMI